MLWRGREVFFRGVWVREVNVLIFLDFLKMFYVTLLKFILCKKNFRFLIINIITHF